MLFPIALKRAIRYALFQLVTVFRFTVTAEVAGSSPVVPATKSEKVEDLVANVLPETSA